MPLLKRPVMNNDKYDKYSYYYLTIICGGKVNIGE